MEARARRAFRHGPPQDETQFGLDKGKGLDPPVDRRPVGVAVQTWALFPRLTVAQTVGHSLRVAGPHVDPAGAGIEWPIRGLRRA